MTDLIRAERAAAGQASGLLVLHHGRGTDEKNLLLLAAALDPERRLHVVAPRAPLQLEGAPGFHWYRISSVGRPEPESFAAAYRALAELHDELWLTTGIAPTSTVLGGFSMGAVMSYVTAFGLGRPQVAGVLALSGFVPEVEGWQPSFEEHARTRVFISHGRADPVIDIRFARAARTLLEEGGIEVDYREFDGGHFVHPEHVVPAGRWLAEAIAADTGGGG